MSNQKELNRIFNEIETKSLTNDFVYRGEPKHYCKVSSNLYRQYQVEVDGENIGIDIDAVHHAIGKEAREYTNHPDEHELMVELQHYGGKTNFIDFTKDYRIALFFACNGFHEKDGRVIFKEKRPTKEYGICEPRSPKNRIIAQKSFFIYPIKGCLDLDDDEFISIPAELKESFLENLNKFHDISTATIYNDLHGFIINKQIHEEAYTEFYTGLTIAKKARKENNPAKRKNLFKKSIRHLSNSIDNYPRSAASYTNRGLSKYEIKKYHKALDDYNKAIELNPKMSEPYNSRGITYMALNMRDEALEDFNKAIELNPEFSDAYHNRGNVKLNLSQYREAIDDFDKSIKFNPKNPEAHCQRGFAKNELHDPTAKQDFEQAIFLAKEQDNSVIKEMAQQALDELEMSEIHPPTGD